MKNIRKKLCDKHTNRMETASIHSKPFHLNSRKVSPFFPGITHPLKTLLLLVIAVLFAGCVGPPTEKDPAISVGFTSNLHDVQPHLAEPVLTREGASVREKEDWDILSAVYESGYDYLELNTAEIALLSDEEFEIAAKRINETGLPVPVTNVFVPGHIKLVGPDTDQRQQDDYLRTAYSRLQRLGVEYIVFGSSGARRIPEGFDRDEAWDQLVAFGRRAAEKAAGYGITILVEPLRRQETNIINTAAEGLELVRQVNHPHFQLMIDFYHMAVENEDPDIVLKAADHLHHLHIANPEGRMFPLSWDEHPFYTGFFKNLRHIGYNKRISIEGRFTDFEKDSKRSIQMMREAMNTEFLLP